MSSISLLTRFIFFNYCLTDKKSHIESSGMTTEYEFKPEKLIERRGDVPKATVARRLGISPQAYWAIENGRKSPSIPLLAKILKYYKLNFFDLVKKQPNNDTPRD